MRPLQGLRVIDLTHVLAGPFATHQLCMMGAEVIKVEKPGEGDQTRGLALRPELKGLSPGFVALNSGKRSVVVNIKTEEGRKVIEKLVATADVFVENFRPGKAAKLGTDTRAPADHQSETDLLFDLRLGPGRPELAAPGLRPRHSGRDRDDVAAGRRSESATGQGRAFR